MAIYFDKESMYNPVENGVQINKLEAADPCPHRDAVVGSARILQEAHIPFGIVTNANLDQFSRYRAVVLPTCWNDRGAGRACSGDFVAAGGALYAAARRL